MAIGTSKVGALGGLVPGGTETFNASGTFCVPPGVKLVSIEGAGGAGDPGNPGNAGNPGNPGTGGGGGMAGNIGGVNASIVSGGWAHKYPWPSNYFSNPPCWWTKGGSCNPAPPVPASGPPGLTGQAGSAGSAGSAGNPGNTGPSSSGLGYCFTGGAGGAAGNAGNAGNAGGGGPGGTGGNSVPTGASPPTTRFFGNGGAGGTGAGSGGPGGNNQIASPAPCFQRYIGGGGGGGAGSINDGANYGPYSPRPPSFPGPDAAFTNAGGGFGGRGNLSPPINPFITNQGVFGYGGTGRDLKVFFGPTPPCTYNFNQANSPQLAQAWPSGASSINQIPANAGPVGGGGTSWLRAGGGGGGGLDGSPNWSQFWTTGGAGGGGRGGAGNAGGTGGAGGAGACANPTTHNCVPVTPGCSYPITVACGGSVTISWNPQ